VLEDGKRCLADCRNTRIKDKMLVNNYAIGCDLIKDGDWRESNVDIRN